MAVKRILLILTAFIVVLGQGQESKEEGESNNVDKWPSLEDFNSDSEVTLPKLKRLFQVKHQYIISSGRKKRQIWFPVNKRGLQNTERKRQIWQPTSKSKRQIWMPVERRETKNTQNGRKNEEKRQIWTLRNRRQIWSPVYKRQIDKRQKGVRQIWDPRERR